MPASHAALRKAASKGKLRAYGAHGNSSSKEILAALEKKGLDEAKDNKAASAATAAGASLAGAFQAITILETAASKMTVTTTESFLSVVGVGCKSIE